MLQHVDERLLRFWGEFHNSPIVHESAVGGDRDQANRGEEKIK